MDAEDQPNVRLSDTERYALRQLLKAQTTDSVNTVAQELHPLTRKRLCRKELLKFDQTRNVYSVTELGQVRLKPQH